MSSPKTNVGGLSGLVKETAPIAQPETKANDSTAELANEMSSDADDESTGTFDLASLLPPAEDQEQTDRKPLAVLKNKRCRRFKVGDFIFKNYMLRLYTMEEVQKFGAAFANLEPMYRNSIVTVDSVALAAAEKPFVSNVIRGSAATSAIPDAKTIK